MHACAPFLECLVYRGRRTIRDVLLPGLGIGLLTLLAESPPQLLRGIGGICRRFLNALGLVPVLR